MPKTKKTKKVKKNIKQKSIQLKIRNKLGLTKKRFYRLSKPKKRRVPKQKKPVHIKIYINDDNFIERESDITGNLSRRQLVL